MNNAKRKKQDQNLMEVCTKELPCAAGMNSREVSETLTGELLRCGICDFEVSRFRCTETQPPIRKLVATQDVIVIQLCIHGGCRLEDDTDTVVAALKASEHCIVYMPRDTAADCYCAADTEVLHIYLTSRLVSQGLQLEQKFLHPFSGTRISAMPIERHQIYPRMQIVMEELLNCSLTRASERLYLMGKSLELLSFHLEQLEQVTNGPALDSLLKQSDIEKMQHVKRLIDKEPHEVLSLTYLAREAGTNEQYLKKHFKLVFGYTVFGYVRALRMEKARQLLASGEHRIADVAMLAGYRYPSHFSKAFKDFFGYLPQALKKKVVLFLALGGTDGVTDATGCLLLQCI